MSFVNTSLGAHRIDTTTGFAPASAGSLGGEQVQDKDFASVLSDAREELSVAFSDKISEKDISERKLTGLPGARRASIAQVEKINAYLEATKRFRDPKEIAALVEQVRNSAHPEFAASRFGGRPSQRYAFLQLALDAALADQTRGRGRPEEIERLQDALADVLALHEDEIHADLNTAQVAADFAPTAQGFETFQQTYTDIVLGKGTLAEALQMVLRRLSGVEGEQFGPALKALLMAMGADLSSSRASTDSVRLQALVQDMYHLEVAGSVLENCTQLSQDLAVRFQLTGVVPMQLMQELVAMSGDRWLTPQRLRELAARFGVQLLLARIAFHSATRNALRKMPVKVFPDGEVRRAMLDTAQQVVDDAVAEEEDREGS